MPARTTWNILLPTFLVSGMLIVVGLGGALHIHRANREISDSLDKKLDALRSAARLVLAIRELRLGLNRFVNSGDVSHVDEAEPWLGIIERESARHGVDPLQGNTDGFRYDHFHERFHQLRGELADDQQRTAAGDLIALLNGELLAPAEKLLDERHQTASETSRKNQVVAERIGLGLLLLGVCGSVSGLLIGFGIANSVHRSLVEISVPVRDMAGRLNEVVGPIQVSFNTDFAQLDDSLRMLATKTADVVRQLQESQRQALRHEQLAALGHLAAGLAHELRNPLMSVKLIVQTATERGTESINQRDLLVIEDEITRLEKMLQSFLDFARPPRLEKRPVKVDQLVEQTLEVVRPRAAQQAVELHFSAGGIPLFVEADESQMRQVLLNLLLNALDVLPGGGNIWICVKKVSRLPETNERVENLPHVVIGVADDGPGLSADVADIVFEPFVSTKDTGIGLGLSICLQIVESHEGRILARNRQEGGAEFTIFLPLCPRESAEMNSVGSGPTRSATAAD